MPVPVVTEPISRVPTRATVAGTLRARIIDGTLAPSGSASAATATHANLHHGHLRLCAGFEVHATG